MIVISEQSSSSPMGHIVNQLMLQDGMSWSMAMIMALFTWDQFADVRMLHQGFDPIYLGM